MILSLTGIQDIDAEKTLTVTQKCENTALHLFVTNQDGKSVKNMHIFDSLRTEVLASADDDGVLVLPADLQDKILRVGGGSYPMTLFTAENCQPYEIQFEKTDQDLMIINHHLWSNFDSTQDYGDGEYAYTGFTGSYVTGDIVNLSEHNLTDIRITVTPFSSQLGTGESKSWYPIKKILRPGEASPFFTNMGGGYDNYSIKIDYYEATSGMPEQPQVKISDIIMATDDNGVESLIINCVDTLEKSNGFRLLLLGYSENNFLESASLTDEFWMSKWDSSASDCITDGKFIISESTNYGNYIDSQYLEYAKNDRFEVFIMQNNRYDLFFEVQVTKEIEDFNALNKQNALPAQTAVYSDYFPNSLTPKYLGVDNFKSNSVKLSENVKSKLNKTDLQKNTNDSYPEIPETSDLQLSTNNDYSECRFEQGFDKVIHTAQKLYSSQKYENAIVCYTVALEIKPEYIHGLIKIGDSLFYSEKYVDSLKTYDQVLEINSNFDILTKLGHQAWLLEGDQKYEEYIVYLDKMLEVDPSSDRRILQKAEILENLGQVDESISHLEKYSEINPENSILKNRLSALKGQPLIDNIVLLESNNQYDEALLEYEKLILIDLRYVDMVFEKGYDLLERQENEHALDYYSKILEHLPNDVDSLYNKGVALTNLERYEDALGIYDKAIVLDDTDADVLMNKGWVLNQLGRHDDAIKYFDKALAINPHDDQTLSNKQFAEAGLRIHNGFLESDDFSFTLLPPENWYRLDVSKPNEFFDSEVIGFVSPDVNYDYISSTMIIAKI